MRVRPLSSTTSSAFNRVSAKALTRSVSGRLVPYHTKCDANYSEADTCLPWRAQLKDVTNVA